MKNSINNVVVASAVALFAANVNADDVQSVINQQVDSSNSVVQSSISTNEPRVTIQDYVEAARSTDAFQASNQTADVRALSGVQNAL